MGVEKRDGLYCLDSIQYQGLLRLYVNYQECLEVSADLNDRLLLSQQSYLLCSDNLDEAIIDLENTNEAYREQVELNNLIRYDIDKYKRQRNGWIIGGISVTAGFSILTYLLIK